MPNSSSPPLAGFRILIVEDQLLVAMEFELLLQELGCTVLGPAPSIEAALRLLSDECPDAALLDVHLPDGRSTPIVTALKERNVPFVVVTGYDLRQLGEPELMNVAWVQKPADHDQLVRTLTRVLAS